jgi:hypothetical protein
MKASNIRARQRRVGTRDVMWSLHAEHTYIYGVHQKKRAYVHGTNRDAHALWDLLIKHHGLT